MKLSSFFCSIFLFFLYLIFFSYLFSSVYSLDLPTEEELKAVFVYNFLKFVVWPQKKEKITLCVLGKTDLQTYLLALDGKTIKDQRIEVKLIDTESIDRCQALFIGKTTKETLNYALNVARYNNILTISDLSGFVKNGGMIEIYSINNKLRFDINLKSAQEANLKISSRLLKLAKKVISL